MKKITLLAFLCALFIVPSLKAQEVTYVEDPAQGYTFNKFKDNWFIMAEGGAGVLMSPFDKKADFSDRIGASFNLTFGKWFSPIIGLRLGADAYQAKGATPFTDALGVRFDEDMTKGAYKQKMWQFGPTADVMINLTNWWCGYRPGRVYNAVFYAGFATNVVVAKENNGTKTDGDWKYAKSNNFSFRGGLLNTFTVSKHVDVLLDLRCDFIQEHFDSYKASLRSGFGTVLVGFAYKFNKTEWNAPIVPVCPTYKYSDAEGDALVSRLQAADAKIASLEQQLRDCLNKKPEVKEVKSEGPLATVYFPIGSSKVTNVQGKLLAAVANAMQQSKDNYVLTGWADNYTGTAKINSKLRTDRAKNVKTVLVKKGVDGARLDTQVNDNNLTNFGAKSASLDRAVTIVVAQ